MDNNPSYAPIEDSLLLSLEVRLNKAKKYGFREEFEMIKRQITEIYNSLGSSYSNTKKKYEYLLHTNFES